MRVSWKNLKPGIKRNLTATIAVVALTCGIGSLQEAQAKDTIRFAVGPYMPLPTDTKKAFEPFFKHIADRLGVDYTLVATTDWAGISVALSANQMDVAMMGPWGYVLAHNKTGAEAIAIMKYDGKSTYHSIITTKADRPFSKWPDDAKGLRLSLGDNGNTSGWLIPMHWFMKNGIDPKSYFQYRDGVAPAANLVSVVNGLSDFASTCDRCINDYVNAGAVPKGALKVVWTSDPLPNDAIAVRKGFDPALAEKSATSSCR